MSRHTGKTTTDHEEIQRWAEERGGHPARVKGTGNANDPGMIRIDFPGYSGSESLEPISWDEWFRQFDDSDLALIYQDRTAGGERSNFNKLVSRTTAEERERRSAHGNTKRTATGRAGTRTTSRTMPSSARSRTSTRQRSSTSRAASGRTSSTHAASGHRGGAKRSHSARRGRS